MTSSPFGNFLDKFKSSTKHAAESMKLAGKITGLKVERTTQKAEKERLLKECGNKVYAIYKKTKTLDSNTLMDEISSALHHLERIDNRIEELTVEMAQLQEELSLSPDNKILDAEVTEADSSESKPQE